MTQHNDLTACGGREAAVTSLDAFARSLVRGGQYSSMSSVLQQGLELPRQNTEAATVVHRAVPGDFKSRVRYRPAERLQL